jgi:hypothetical protein
MTKEKERFLKVANKEIRINKKRALKAIKMIN